MFNPNSAGSYCLGCAFAADGAIIAAGFDIMAEGGLAIPSIAANLEKTKQGEPYKVWNGVSDSEDWVPGDAGTIANAKNQGGAATAGENIIYLGREKYWGFGGWPKARMVRSRGEWMAQVNEWGEGHLNDNRKSTNVGLLNK
jgi:hypothetical protein